MTVKGILKELKRRKFSIESAIESLNEELYSTSSDSDIKDIEDTIDYYETKLSAYDDMISVIETSI